MKKVWFTVVLAASVASAASAQVSTINGVQLQPRVYNDDASSNLTFTSSYPSNITIEDQNVDADNPGTYANRHIWEFSSDGGTTAYQFNKDDYFSTSMTLTLTALGGTVAPRREAGFVLNNAAAGQQGQYIVNTDSHEVVAFGGQLPYYQFKGTGTPTFSGFNSGDTVVIGMTYFLDPSTNINSIIYTANDLTQGTGLLTSPTLPFTNNEVGIITGTTIGGYAQIPIDTTNPNNGITAVFSNISISAAPEPSGFIAMLVGILPLGALLLRRRRASR